MNYYLSMMLICGWVSICAANPLVKVNTPNAPQPYGAYSQAITVNIESTKNLIFVSGQVPYDPKNGKMVANDIHSATNLVLDHIEGILKAANSGWGYVVRTDVFLKNMERDWAGMDEEYAKRFPNGLFPARQATETNLGRDTLVEISCVAIVPK